METCKSKSAVKTPKRALFPKSPEFYAAVAEEAIKQGSPEIAEKYYIKAAVVRANEITAIENKAFSLCHIPAIGLSLR